MPAGSDAAGDDGGELRGYRSLLEYLETILLAGAGCYLLACVVLPDDRRAKVRRDEREDAQFRMQCP